MDQTGYGLIAFGMTAVLAVDTVIAVKFSAPRWVWGATAFTTLCIVIQVAAILDAFGVLVDTMIFLATLGGCVALIGGVLWWMKHRPTAPPFDDRTQEQPQRNYVPRQATMAYGTYTAADVQAARRDAQRIRKGRKA